MINDLKLNNFIYIKKIDNNYLKVKKIKFILNNTQCTKHAQEAMSDHHVATHRLGFYP